MDRRQKRIGARAAEERSLHVLDGATITAFRKTIYDYYLQHGRKMPWRETADPYHILVSEIMLQQTQVGRVVDKFAEFVANFPDIPSLDRSSLQEVLSVWQGLGYNRRALALKTVAKQIMEELAGIFPRSMVGLMRLKGVGRSTAGAIMAFAFNTPVAFIETNIRTVFIHHFFADDVLIADAQILPLIDATLDRENPRVWYWALMDYGAMLKKNGRGMNAKSSSYQKQSRFHGSSRQVRGRILKTLVSSPGLTKMEIARETGFSPDRIDEAAERLETEGFIVCEAGRYRISG